MFTQMDTKNRKRSSVLPEVPLPVMEQTEKEQTIMPAPKDPIKNAEWRKRMSEAMKNLPESVKQKRINSVIRSLTGKPRPEEVRKKIGAGQLGKTRPEYNERLSNETRLKLSLATKGIKRTEENRRKISDGCKGKPKSEEHKQNISIAKRGYPSPRKGIALSDDTKAKLREVHLGMKVSYDTRLKMCESHLGGFWYGNVIYDTDPQYCEKWTHGFRERVRAAFDYTCQFHGCGHIWKDGEKRLAVHHINYRKDSCCNPEVRPLFIPVCPGSCHAKTNNDRDKWERYFTELIERDYDGRCFLKKEEMRSY